MRCHNSYGDWAVARAVFRGVEIEVKNTMGERVTRKMERFRDRIKSH